MLSTHELEIYLEFTEKSECDIFFFISLWRFTISRVTVFRTKRQRIVCDKIPGSIKLASSKKRIIIQRHNVRQVTS